MLRDSRTLGITFRYTDYSPDEYNKNNKKRRTDSEEVRVSFSGMSFLPRANGSTFTPPFGIRRTETTLMPVETATESVVAMIVVIVVVVIVVAGLTFFYERKPNDEIAVEES